MARKAQFRESSHAANLVLHNMQALLTKLEETIYSTKAGISYQQFLVLVTTESCEPPVSQTVIARRLQRNLNSISMIIDRMEKLRLVTRVRSEDDRRETHISLTRLGREKLAGAVKVGSTLTERLGSVFTDADLQEAMRLMTKLSSQILKEMGKEPMPATDERNYRRRVVDVFKQAGQ